MIEFDKPELVLVLPAALAGVQWVEEPLDDGYEFTHDVWQLEVIVSVLPAKRTLSDNQMKWSAEELVRLQQECARKAAKGRCEFGETQWQQRSGEFHARFSGSVARQRIQFSVGLFSRPSKVVTVALHQYGGGMDEKEFGVLANAVLDLVRIKEEQVTSAPQTTTPRP